MADIIARNNRFEENVPEYVENFYSDFYNHESSKVEDMDYTLIREDGEYYVTLFQNIWKNAEEIHNLDKTDYEPEEVYNEAVSFVKSEFGGDKSISIIEDGDTGDFYSFGIKVKVEEGEGEEKGERIMSVLPYDA
jgi:hypothetical protein